VFGLSLLISKITFLFGDSITAGAKCDLAHQTFFFLPPWWEYLSGQYDPLLKCSPNFAFPNDIFPVGLAILDMLLRLAGFAAVMGIIISGIQYITAVGSPEKITNARKHWINAFTGLAIALVATAAVSFIGRSLVG